MTPPSGVQILAGVALRAGHEARLYDTRLSDPSSLVIQLDEYDPHIVGLSFLSPSARQAENLALMLRRPGRLTVAGGVHASLHADDLVARDVFDCVVRREGENALLDICDAISSGTLPQPLIDGQPVGVLDRVPRYPDLDCYRDVYDLSRDYRSVYIQLGRGCPMHCTYCEVPIPAAFQAYNKRMRTLDSVMADVHEYVGRWNINFVTLLDSIATLNTELIEGFVERMDTELPQVGFMFNGHANRFQRSLAEKVGAAQAHRSQGERITVWFGFESGSQRLLDFMNKSTTVDKGLAVASLCNEHDIQLGANLLIGVPTETPEDYSRHREFMDAIRPTFPNPNILNPLPGTGMHAYCVEHELLRDPADYSIWLHSEIEKRGAGPLKGIDYRQVLDEYYRYHPEHRPSEPRYRPWASSEG